MNEEIARERVDDYDEVKEKVDELDVQTSAVGTVDDQRESYQES